MISSRQGDSRSPLAGRLRRPSPLSCHTVSTTRARLKHLTLQLIDGAATREDVGTLKASVKQLSYAGLYGPEGDAGYSSKIRV